MVRRKQLSLGRKMKMWLYNVLVVSIFFTKRAVAINVNEYPKRLSSVETLKLEDCIT